jgi:hypothetical protein
MMFAGCWFNNVIGVIWRERWILLTIERAGELVYNSRFDGLVRSKSSKSCGWVVLMRSPGVASSFALRRTRAWSRGRTH